ncbi:MAG: glutamine--fructose-6-phosphate transaminase (isomerizing), partial [Bacteroidales bacterium]|nr:glutamine--fructose-6-phosphate transaminase (isomerizing) [Bacteroidales bacterium]
MCGIVGYTGKLQAAPILLEGLSKLEYRGYDSAGIAVRDGSGAFELVKAKGRLQNLYNKTDGGKALSGTCGIGHTRWATHGEPSEINAHPHISDMFEGSGTSEYDSDVIGVHNGIIENYQELADKMVRNGYTFYSQTDTEVLIKLVDYYYKKYTHDPIDAMAKTMVRVRGSFALALMFRDRPGEIYTARKDSPLVIGVTEDAAYLASDVPALLRHTRDVCYIGNLEMARLIPGKAEFYNLDGDMIDKPVTRIEWDAEAAEKGGYEHFMIKEIHEQPRAVRDTINSALTPDGSIEFKDAALTDEELSGISQIYIAACGSAYHVGVTAQYVIEDLTGIPVRVDLASEFRYRNLPLGGNALAVFISQSGETADTLAALRKAKEKGLRTLAIVNVLGSSIAREADGVIYTLAGPEISVATTKAYSAQLIVCYLLALKLARVRGTVGDKEYSEMVAELTALPDKIESILGDKERIQWFASKHAHDSDMFFIGRGVDYSVSMEGSLKMKEISYIHSEAYPAGE